MNHQVKNFEELRDYLLEEKHNLLEDLADRLEELSEFQRGRFQGEIRGIEAVMYILRNALKYGDIE